MRVRPGLPRVRALLYGLVVLDLTAACNGVLGPGSLRGRQAELLAARRRWAAQGFTSYRYRFQYLCFCPVSLVQPVEITVRGGRVTEVVDPSSGLPVPSAPGRPLPTVEELFDVVQRAIERDVDFLGVAYDPVLSYPTTIRVDPVRNAVDEEQSYFAGGLKQIP